MKLNTLLDRMPQYDRLISTVKSLAARTDEVTTQIGGVAYTRAPALPINPWKFRVWMQTTVQSLASNATTVVKFDSVDYDSVNGWDATNFLYTVPVGGVWVLSWHINVNTTGQPNIASFRLTADCSVNRGGSLVYFKQINCVAGTNTAASVIQTGYDSALTDEFLVIAGDQVQVSANQFNDLGVALNLSKGGTLGQYVSLAGHLISG